LFFYFLRIFSLKGGKFSPPPKGGKKILWRNNYVFLGSSLEITIPLSSEEVDSRDLAGKVDFLLSL
jgi:hypothetical protein